jgi:hypothetical protein
MSEQVQYIAILKDEQFIGGLNKIAGVGNATWSKLNSMLDKFQAETTQSAAGMDKMDAKMHKLKSSGDMLSHTFDALFAGFGIFELFQLGKSSLEEFDNQAKANSQTMAVLASTHAVAGKSLEDLQKQAGDFQKITLFGDDEIQGAQNMMLTFTKVRGEIFDQTIPAVLDLSTAMGQDLKSSSIQIGKALNDPIAGVTALRRVGVQFTDSQENMIKKLVETGQLEEAQKIILQELTTEFGGSAKAAYEAANPLMKLKNRFGEIKESAGGLISQVLDFLTPAFTGFASVLEKVIGWIDRNQVLVGTLVAYLGSFLGAILLVVTAVKIWTGVQWLLSAAMTATPIGAIIVAIVALIGFVIYLWNKFEGFRGFLVGLWESFKAVFTNIRELAGNVLGGIGELLIGVFTFDKEKIMSGFSKLKSGFVEYGTKVGESFKTGYEKGVEMKGKTDANGKPVIGAAAIDPNAVGGGAGTDTGQAIGSFSGSENRKTINITVGSLVQKLELHATNIQGGIENIKEEVQRILLSAVNNANMIAG